MRVGCHTSMFCFSSLSKVLKLINSRYIFIGFKRLDICIVYYFILLYTITCEVPWAEEVMFAILWSRVFMSHKYLYTYNYEPNPYCRRHSIFIFLSLSRPMASGRHKKLVGPIPFEIITCRQHSIFLSFPMAYTKKYCRTDSISDGLGPTQKMTDSGLHKKACRPDSIQNYHSCHTHFIRFYIK